MSLLIVTQVDNRYMYMDVYLYVYLHMDVYLDIHIDGCTCIDIHMYIYTCGCISLYTDVHLQSMPVTTQDYNLSKTQTWKVKSVKKCEIKVSSSRT